MGRRADTVYGHDEAAPFALKSARYDCRRSEYNFINEPFFTFSADNANVIRLETFNQAFLTSFNVRASERRGGKRISLPADLLSHVTTAMIDPGRPGETGEITTAVRSEAGVRWWKFVISPRPAGQDGRRQMAGYGQDITDHRQSVRDIKRLSDKLLDVQDQERRRIARELHDSTAQHLVAVGIGLSRLDVLMEDPCGTKRAYRELITEIRSSLAHAHSEIRTTSLLLHPPVPKEADVASALRSLVGGFAKRSGIRTILAIDEDLECRSPEVARTIMRIVQEALTNIYRHAAASESRVSLSSGGGRLTLDVEDNGRGFAGRADPNPDLDIETMGVGIPGMRARLRQFHGELALHDTCPGFHLRAVIPQAGVRRRKGVSPVKAG